MKGTKATLGLLIFLWILFMDEACQNRDLISPDETILPFKKLSEYHIYQGNPSALNPTTAYKVYELSSQLFTDHAEKQRLIKLPPGTQMTAIDDGLPDFPEGTIIVKTFYYFKDKRSPTHGNQLIETRILELIHGKWIAGTYLWNEAQTDANLIGTGLHKTINWIDETGNGNVVSYHIPSNLECRTCHNSNKTVVPIGPKIRNLNFDVMRDSVTLNQLTYFHNEGILNPVVPTVFSTLPNYKDLTKTLEQRGRAYLDINCAHCHSENGFAANREYRMAYETDLKESKISTGVSPIKNKIKSGEMPKLGTTVIDKEGLELINKYLDTL